MKKRHHPHADATIAITQPPRVPAEQDLVPHDPEGHGHATGGRQATEDELRAIAYAKWQADGCPPGDGLDYWLAAERDLDGSQ